MNKFIAAVDGHKTKMVAFLIVLVPLLASFNVITAEQAEAVGVALVGAGVWSFRDALRKIEPK